MKETTFSKKVVKALEDKCAFIINVHGHLMQRRGIPDLEVIHRKWHGFLELKVDKNTASDVQKKVAKKIALRDVPVWILRCTDIDISKLNLAKWNKMYKITLEDFNGKLIAKVNRLDMLIDVLVDIDWIINDPCEDIR